MPERAPSDLNGRGHPDEPGDKRVAGVAAARIEALVDGIFAIVMTLLILDLHVPHLAAGAPAAELARALLALWPRALVYLMSFLSLGTLWVAHRFAFHYIHRTDRTLLWLNLVFLILVGVIPFLTGLIGQYPTYTLPVALYGVDLILAGATLYRIWGYATADHRLVGPHLTPEAIRAGRRRILVGPAFYLLALALAFVDGWLAIAIYALVPLAYALPGRLDSHLFGPIPHPSRRT
jgi:uncharacterized membrane protein